MPLTTVQSVHAPSGRQSTTPSDPSWRLQQKLGRKEDLWLRGPFRSEVGVSLTQRPTKELSEKEVSALVSRFGCESTESMRLVKGNPELGSLEVVFEPCSDKSEPKDVGRYRAGILRTILNADSAWLFTEVAPSKRSPIGEDLGALEQEFPEKVLPQQLKPLQLELLGSLPICQTQSYFSRGERVFGPEALGDGSSREGSSALKLTALEAFFKEHPGSSAVVVRSPFSIKEIDLGKLRPMEGGAERPEYKVVYLPGLWCCGGEEKSDLFERCEKNPKLQESLLERVSSLEPRALFWLSSPELQMRAISKLSITEDNLPTLNFFLVRTGNKPKVQSAVVDRLDSVNSWMLRAFDNESVLRHAEKKLEFDENDVERVTEVLRELKRVPDLQKKWIKRLPRVRPGDFGSIESEEAQLLALEKLKVGGGWKWAMGELETAVLGAVSPKVKLAILDKFRPDFMSTLLIMADEKISEKDKVKVMKRSEGIGVGHFAMLHSEELQLAALDKIEPHKDPKSGYYFGDVEYMLHHAVNKKVRRAILRRFPLSE